MNLQAFVEKEQNVEDLEKRLMAEAVAGVYSASVQLVQGNLFFMVRDGMKKSLVIVGTGQNSQNFVGENQRYGAFDVKVAPLSPENAQALRALFPWTGPQAFGEHGISLGLGDRLGLASPGHIQAIRGTPVRPVLAQQSMRELDLTNRSYGDVLDAATWAVFQSGYTDGYGADGDHLKKVEDIKTALDLGFSMITLDCSEHIHDEVHALDSQIVAAQYAELPEVRRNQFEGLYQGVTHPLKDGSSIYMDPQHFHSMILTYVKALDFIEEVYIRVISKLQRPIDFEVSIDEVATPTTPQAHFFVANELARRGIKVSGIAPRFCGQFEKGIDYIGDLAQFEAEFAIHATIAQHFGYKLSIHSGSDKFSVFPIVGKHAAGQYHVKTAGTNWLEAVRVIAMVDPELYRQIHTKALTSLEAARKYYKVGLDLAKVPDIASLGNDELPDLLNQNDARQLLHITYGFILQDSELHEAIYAILERNEQAYANALCTHLTRHLKDLGL